MPGLNPRLSRRQLIAAGAAAVPVSSLLLGGRAGASGGDAITLRLSDFLGDQVDHYLPRMEELTGITIDHEVYAQSDYKLMTQLASGTAPDMFNITADYNGDFLPYPDLYVPFNDALAARNVDMSKWALDPLEENGYEGKIAGLSLCVAQDLCVHVNTEMAEASGLLADAPLWGTPNFDKWSWDTFVDWLKEGTHRNSNGEIEQYGMGSLPAFGGVFQNWVYDFGGTLFDDDWNYNETVSRLDSEECLAAAMRFYDLVFTHEVAVPPELESTIQGQSQTGSYLAKQGMSTIMLSTGSIYPEEGNFPMSYFHMPFAVNRTHGIGLSQWCVYGDGEHVDESLDWLITFETDPEVAKLFLQHSSAVPAYDPLTTVNAAPEGNPKTLALINLSRIPDFSEVPDNAATTVNFPRWFGRFAGAQTGTIIETALQQIVGGSKTPQEALAEAKEQLDAKIESGRQSAGL